MSFADVDQKLRYPTMASAAQAAIDVQNACNLSGVVLSMRDALETIRATDSPQGTMAVNRHPVAQLFAYKVMALALEEPLESVRMGDMFTAAYTRCKELAS